MKKMRVKTGIEIEVNKAGETIYLPIGDAAFINGYGNLIKDVSGMVGDEDADYISVSKKLCEKIDAVIGEGTCRKVFGNVVPTPQVFVDFFELLSKTYEDYAEERRALIESRYNRNRRGNHV